MSVALTVVTLATAVAVAVMIFTFPWRGSTPFYTVMFFIVKGELAILATLMLYELVTLWK